MDGFQMSKGEEGGGSGDCLDNVFSIVNSGLTIRQEAEATPTERILIMVKAIAGSIIVVLLVGSSALALGEIFQGFNFDASLAGSIALPSGPGAGSLAQNLAVNNNQAGEGVGTAASQGLQGLLFQAGNAEGLCAGLTVDQVLVAGSIDAAIPFGGSGSAGQIQSIAGCLGQIGQGQGVGLIGSQVLTKDLGPGNADAFNSLLLNQGQEATNTMGTASETSCLAVMQNSLLSGEAGSTGMVMTTISAGTAQMQSVEQGAQ